MVANMRKRTPLFWTSSLSEKLSVKPRSKFITNSQAPNSHSIVAIRNSQVPNL
uniref:Uncharacterized protein n=1 Tax=Arundo donax TaxID=35708 RepID=A0A0A9H7M8_ARUDO